MALSLAQLLEAPTTYVLGQPVRVPAPCLKESISADVAIIGAGYTGLAAARVLGEAGRQVVVLESGAIGCGASGRNGGQMIPGFNLPQPALQRLFGHDTANTLWQAVEATRHALTERINQTTDRCDMQPGIVYAAFTPQQLDEAGALADGLKQDYGYPHLRLIGRNEIRNSTSPCFIGGVEWTDAHHVNPHKLLLLALALAQSAGCTLYEHTPALSLEGEQGRYTIATPQGSVKAREVVLATGASFTQLRGLGPRTAPSHVPIATFVLATEPCEAARILPTAAATSDLRNAMSYFRRMPDGRILYGGEVGMPLVNPTHMLRRLEREMRRILPGLGEVKIERSWAGLIDMTRTTLPSVRELRAGLYQADGFSGHGLVLSVLAGESIARQIVTAPQRQCDSVYAALTRIRPQEMPSNRGFALVLQGLRWLPRLLQDWRSA